MKNQFCLIYLTALFALFGCASAGHIEGEGTHSQEKSAESSKASRNPPKSPLPFAQRKAAQSSLSGPRAHRKTDTPQPVKANLDDDKQTRISVGEKLYKQYNCVWCHSNNLESERGPNINGIWGLTRVFKDGGFQTADEPYIRESIVDHDKKIVGGYQPSTYTSKNPPLTEKQLDALMEFISDIGLRDQMKENTIASLYDFNFDNRIFNQKKSTKTQEPVECRNLSDLFGEIKIKSENCESLKHSAIKIRDFMLKQFLSIQSRIIEVNKSLDWALQNGHIQGLLSIVQDSKRISGELLIHQFDLRKTVREVLERDNFNPAIRKELVDKLNDKISYISLSYLLNFSLKEDLLRKEINSEIQDRNGMEFNGNPWRKFYLNETEAKKIYQYFISKIEESKQLSIDLDKELKVLIEKRKANESLTNRELFQNVIQLRKKFFSNQSDMCVHIVSLLPKERFSNTRWAELESAIKVGLRSPNLIQDSSEKSLSADNSESKCTKNCTPQSQNSLYEKGTKRKIGQKDELGGLRLDALEQDIGQDLSGNRNISGKVAIGVKAAISSPKRGKDLFKSLGCDSCHSEDGTQKSAPTVKSLYGKLRRLKSGKTVRASELYLLESILYPGKQIVEPYANVMPAYKDKLSYAEAEDIVEYIKSLTKP